MYLNGIEYDRLGSEPCRCRCAWDDRFALAAVMYRLWINDGKRVAVEFAGENLLTDDGGIATYKTAILTFCEVHETPIDCKPSELLPPGWIDRGATASLQSPGTWFQSEKWDLVSCEVLGAIAWKLMCRPHGEPVDGLFDTKEAAFAYSEKQGCITINNSTLIGSDSLFTEDWVKPEPKQETWRDRAIKDPLF